jgi:molybdopterin-containing oxidoreductase family membrane subunit
MEIVVCGLLPALILITDKGRKTPATLWTAVILASLGVLLNRWVMVLQVMAVPVVTYESWFTYFPSWQEIATTILPVAYGVIMIMISYRYMPIFPQEAELNPIEEPEPPAAEAEAVEEESDEAAAPEVDLAPAEA